MKNKLVFSLTFLISIALYSKDYWVRGAKLEENIWNKFDFVISDPNGSLAKIEIHLNHPNYGDLEALLVSPAGDSIEIFDRSIFGSGRNRLVFSVNNGLHHFNDNPGFILPFRMEYSQMSEIIKGNWSLLIKDHITGDLGSVKMLKVSFEDINRTPSPPNEQDCQGAIPVCNNVYANPNSYVGTGNIPNEINSGISCLGSGEKNDVWYVLTVQSSGQLGFSINPNNNNDDYDWAVYDLTNAGCEDIRANRAIEMSCNYSGTRGVTGANGLSGSQYNQRINVSEGMTVVLNISNFSSSQSGYSLDFGNSTATIFDNSPPELESAENVPICGQSSVNFSFSENIICSSLSIADLELEGPNGTAHTISSISGPCSSGASFGKDFTLNVSPPLNLSGDYSLKLIPGAGFVRDNCGNTASAGAVSFQVNGLQATLTTTDASCSTGPGSASISVPPGTGTVNYLWDLGTSSETTSSVSNLSAGNYSVTVSKTGGCSYVENFTINSSGSIPQPTIDSEDKICSNEKFLFSAPNLSGGSYSYFWDFGGITNSSLSNPDSVSLPAGMHTITLAVSNGSCNASNTKIVEVEEPITLSISGEFEYCQNEAISLQGQATANSNSGTNYTYSWQIDNGQRFNNQNPLNIPSGIASPDDYNVLLTSDNGVCKVLLERTISINEGLDVDLGDNVSFCDGDSATLDTQYPGLSYSWSTGASEQAITVHTAGAYSVTISNTNGCIGTDEVIVTVNQNPVVDLGDDASICQGNTMTLNAGAGYNYNWSSGESTQTIDASEAKAYTVTITDGNGCESSDDVLISINQNPVVDLGNDASICQGNTMTLDAGAGYDYVWSTGEISQTINVSTTNTYTVTITDRNDCKSSDEVSISVNQNPDVDLGNNFSICEGDDVSLDAGIGYDYFWSTGETSQSINISESNIYSVTITDGNGCKSSDEVSISVNQNPDVDLGNNLSICEGDDVTLDAGIGYDYFWSTGEISQTINVSATNSYTVTITDQNGCIGKDEIELIVHNKPTVNLGNDASFCSGSSLTLDAGAGYDYLWSTGESSQTIEVSNPNAYSVTITDANGCEGMDNIILNEVAKPNVDLGNDTAICEGDNVILDAGPGYSYAWSTGDNSQSIVIQSTNTYSVTITDGNGCSNEDDIDVIALAYPIVSLGNDITICEGESIVLDAQNPSMNYTWNTGALSQHITVNSPGTYSVEVQNDIGCSDRDDIIITQEVIIDPYFEKEKIVCLGRSIFLEPDTNLYYDIWWADNNSSRIEVNEPGVYTSFVQGNFCADTFEITVIQKDTPSVSIIDLKGQDYYCFENENTKLRVLSNEIGLEYLWNVLDRNYEIPITDGGVYSVVVQNNSCKSRLSIEIDNYCSAQIFVPNAFTPYSTHGLNDVFKPVFIGNIQDYEFNIFNRWGELIFFSNEIENGWDGQINGKPAPMALYTYHIRYNLYSRQGGILTKHLTGTFLLLQ